MPASNVFELDALRVELNAVKNAGQKEAK